MTSEPPPSESPTRKRQRRSKQDPQFVFESPVAEQNDSESKSGKQSPVKTNSKPLRTVESLDGNADLYEPGDVVWCKLGSFPWWPALIYRCDAEEGIHTKVLNSNNKPKRQFFVYFYGKYLEYSWISTRWLLKYAGLSSFIQNAEAAVQQASTKSEQQELANRFQLKVSMKKRVQWDEAIELADRALAMTNVERIEEFSDLLKEALDTKSQSKNGVRRRKASLDKSQEQGADDQVKQHEAQATSTPSEPAVPAPKPEKKSGEKPSISLRKPAVFAQNGTPPTPGTDTTGKRKRAGKTDSEIPNADRKKNSSSKPATPISANKSSIKTRTSRSSTTSKRSPGTEQQQAATNGTEVEYDYPSTTRADQTISPALLRLIPMNIPPLSNFEQKQIVEGLLHHPNEKALNLEEAQTFATNKAIEIVFANHNYRVTNIPSEWFYDAILLKYPAVAFQYRSWFEHVKRDAIPNGNDLIQLKQWQVALMIDAQIKGEQEVASGKN